MKHIYIFAILYIIIFTYSISPQPIVVDGDLNDAAYIVLSVKQNNNLGFGNDIDVRKILYFPDLQNQKLYLGIEGKMNTGSSDGIGIFLNFTEVTGLPAGSSLGGEPGGHFMGNTGNTSFKADFEVDYMFALNPGGGNSAVYLDAVKLSSGRSAQYIGNSDQTGTAAQGPSSAGLFGVNTLQFAFNNSGSAYKGFEVSIPFSELGITSAGELQVFTFIVSSTAYFSDVTVPGNITTGNPGFNPQFSSLSGGPFHSVNAALPVELVSFTAAAADNKIILNWKTSSETNNRGFVIEKQSGDQWYEIGFVDGAGTTTEEKMYVFYDEILSFNGKISYRLRQTDLNGSFTYSSVADVLLNPAEYALLQNYPNPFNPSTVISYSLAEDGLVTLKVYDILGREAALLVNEHQSKGSYQINFNASGLTAGMYIYELNSGSYTSSGKMILMK